MASLRIAKLHLHEGDLVETGTTREGAADRPERMLMCDLLYGHWGQCSSTYSIVPAGYVTDLFSLPTKRTRQIWQPKHAENGGPSVVHDWEYDLAAIPRAVADFHFRIAMKDMEYKLHQKWGGWAAVRIGGFNGYGKPTPINQELINTFRNQQAENMDPIVWLFQTRDQRYERVLARLNEIREANGLSEYVPPTEGEEA